LKRTALKRHKRLNPVSPRQAALNEEWREITDSKARELGFICQWCHRPGGYLDGHHIIKRRYNIHTKENCYVCHRLCHSFIEEHNIDVTVYRDEEAWKAKPTPKEER